MYKVYAIINKINGKMYIGSTKRDLKIRLQRHFTKVIEGSQASLHKAIRKYGKYEFDIRMVEEYLTKESMLNGEVEWISYFDTYKSRHGYNETPGGDGGNTNEGKKFSKEWKEKISNAKKGKTFSEEHKENLSKSHMGNVPTNRKLTLIEAEEIRLLYNFGEISQKELGKKFNLSQPSVNDIIRNKTYRKV